ncbi:MAG: OmpA family protein [Bdellovibrionaceae bacterium]|nr:OmpA family protein [Pseudobdellovibrionaceae bacterium]MBX3034104.1 OmpA family protein [Pseudobdellovibrionaceae bacterium]
MGAAKKKKHEEHENHERWLVSYADFITLLFAFFVVLYATSTSNVEKQKEFEESVRAEMKLAVVGGGQQGPGEGADGIVADLLNPLDRFPRRGGPAEVRDFVERKLKQTMTKEEQEKYVLEVRSDPMGARISLASSAFFPAGSTKLLKSGLETLDKVAGVLQTSNRRLVVEAHTDNQPVDTTEYPSNWELAGLRATSVLRYLVKYHGISPRRMAAMSFGDQQPVAPNDTEEHRAKNRRIDILITTDQEE